MKFLHFLSLLFLPALMTTPAFSTVNTAQIESLISDKWGDKTPGGGVIAVQGGKIIFEAYRGLEDLESQKPITKNTTFKYASITKRLVAAAVFSYIENDELALDDPIGKHLDALKSPIADITVEELLTHTNGIPSFYDFEKGKNYTTAEHIDEISKLELLFKPNEKNEYSSNGYILLGAILEKLSGKPWHTITRELVVPEHTTSSIKYIQTHIEEGRQIITAYDEKEDVFIPAEIPSPGLAHAAGGMAGTIRDIAEWLYAFHNGQIISKASVVETHKKPKLKDGSSGFFGKGLFYLKVRGKEIPMHSGNNPGLGMESLYLPEQDIAVIVASNTTYDAFDVALRTAAILLGDPYPVFTETDIAGMDLTPYWELTNTRGVRMKSCFSKTVNYSLNTNQKTPSKYITLATTPFSKAANPLLGLRSARTKKVKEQFPFTIMVKRNQSLPSFMTKPACLNKHKKYGHKKTRLLAGFLSQ